MNQNTSQESFWAGSFGDDYVARNDADRWLPSNTALFARILAATQGVESVLELGANIGLNLRALRALRPSVRLSAVEINAAAVDQLRKLGLHRVHHGSLLSTDTGELHDLAFTKGVLIHVAPEHLPGAYDALYRASRRYVMVMEYYNPSPVELPYRGHSERMYKRDFAGEMLDRFPDLRLVDYAFVYRRDPNFPLDDGTWFLMEKVSEVQTPPQ